MEDFFRRLFFVPIFAALNITQSPSLRLNRSVFSLAQRSPNPVLLRQPDWFYIAKNAVPRHNIFY